MSCGKKIVIIFEGFWTCDDVRQNPNCLFVFGDNDIQLGKGGQAIIRDEINSIGIPTKKRPSIKSDSDFYNDEEYEENKKKIDIAICKVLKEFMKNKYTALVLPKDGLGTGLAQLNKRAPKTFNYLVKKLKCIRILFS